MMTSSMSTIVKKKTTPSVVINIPINRRLCKINDFQISAQQMCHVNQAYCSPAVLRTHRDCENNYNTFILKLGGYVEMQIFG